MIVRPFGAGAVLVECAAPETLGLLAQIDDALAPLGSAVIEVVPGIGSIVITHPLTEPARTRIVEALSAIVPTLAAPAVTTAVALDVRYDGADLDDLARSLGMAAAEVIARHSAATYRVACCGFAPGFAYLTGLDPALNTPRLESPRPRVPAGAVAIAGRYTGVYPRPSPGGWTLLGSCDAELFNLDRDPPALLEPGMTVRFRVAATGSGRLL